MRRPLFFKEFFKGDRPEYIPMHQIYESWVYDLG